MPLTRLDNLISSKTGKYLYVSPDDFNATDALDNRGNSLLRPFVTIQRAFLEAARFSYLPNVDNDRFDQFTIMLSPGIHYIDNRPGITDVESLPVFQYNQSSGEWEANTNVSFNLSDSNNILYKFNGREGGATIPRGTSLVGQDLRRTQLRPLYVPDPADYDIGRTSLFNVTGGCYFWQFTIQDGDIESSSPLYDYTDLVGKVYTQPNNNANKAIPQFSHHKITNFVYADKEDLGLLYRKIAQVFSDFQPTINDVYVEGFSSPVTEGWSSTKNYITGEKVVYNGEAYSASNPSTNARPNTDASKWTRLVIRGREFDFRVQENRIVGPLQDAVRLDAVRVTDSSPAGLLTVTVRTKINHGFFPGQYVAITNNELNRTLNGVFQVYSISTTDPKEFIYRVPTTATGLGLVSGSTYTSSTVPSISTNASVQAEIDSVESASPYVFNVSIRSTWGICGIWADGRKATGFKSMVIAQYTGVSLQKDDRAFIRYDEFSNTWNQAPLTDAFATTPYHIKGDAYWKDDWRNFHVKASDDSFIQCVSIFAVGFADHFLMESGGDMSITNSNSNFGNTSLHAIGYKGFAFNQDKGGYITDIIPPKSLTALKITKQQYYSIDAQLTRAAQNTTKLYLGSDDARNAEDRPSASVDGYRIGAKREEKLYVKLDTTPAKSAELTPTGFKKWTAAVNALNPNGATFTTEYNLAQDAANIIDSNKTFIQAEAFGYILEKYPGLRDISYVNPNITAETGRYRDASNLIRVNRQEIIDTAYTASGGSIPADINGTKCKRDIGYIVDAIATDLYTGGNSNIINATKAYFDGTGALLNNGLVGEIAQSVVAFNSAATSIKSAITNQLTIKDLTITADPATGSNVSVNSCANVRTTVDNLVAVITTALNSSSLSYLPSSNPGPWSSVSEISKCSRDIGYIIEAITSDLRLGGNENSINAAESYYTAISLASDIIDGNPDGFTLDYINGEKSETLDAYNYVRDLAISAMRNHNTYLSGVSTVLGSAVVTVPSTVGLTIGMRVRSVANIPTGTGTNVSTNYNDALEEQVDGIIVPKSTNITSTIPNNTYIKKIGDGLNGLSPNQIELGSLGSKFNSGVTVNATATSTTIKLFVNLTKGIWSTSLDPVTDTSIDQDYNYNVPGNPSTGSPGGECASVASSIVNYFTIINTVINNGVNVVPRVASVINTASLAQRSTIFTLTELDSVGNITTNPHNLETGTPIRLVPRAKKGVTVDKRLIRLPKGFDTNTLYYVIAPGRKTDPFDYSTSIGFDGNNQQNLMLATSEENAAAGIYIYSSETDSIDRNVEIDVYQYVLDSTYDLHRYQTKLADGSSTEFETDRPHNFDIPSNNVVPQQVFFRVGSDIPGSSLPTLSSNFGGTTVSSKIEYYVRYVNSNRFTIHQTFANARDNINPVTFAAGSTSVFYVFASKKRSPLKYDPSIGTTQTDGCWYLETLSATNTIVPRLKLNDFFTRLRTTDTYYERITDNRTPLDRLYRLRYVIPKNLKTVRDPLSGFVIKARTDEKRRLLPQKIVLKPTATGPAVATFNAPLTGERLGLTLAEQRVLNPDFKSTYDPSPQGNFKRIETNSKISFTVQSARKVLSGGVNSLQLTVFDVGVDAEAYKTKLFTTVKISAPQGGSGSFVSSIPNTNSSNLISWNGYSSGTAHVHAYFSYAGQNYLILKDFGGNSKLDYSSTPTVFTQGSVSATLLDEVNFGKSLVENNLYVIEGANVYTMTPGDTVNDDNGVSYTIESVEDVSDMQDSFYIFSIETIRRRIAGQQDGIYYLTCVRGNISPYPVGSGVGNNFRNFKFSQPVSKLYPEFYKNDPEWYKGIDSDSATLLDPPPTISSADNYIHGLVTVNDSKNSISKEMILDFVADPGLKNNLFTGSNKIQAQSGSASAGSETRKIPISGDSVYPLENKFYVELRRPSIARSGNHTFEYLGFGPGNYSTGFPSRQEVVLTDVQDFYAQAKRQDAGIVFYTGLNSNGDLYIGNRKINAITGEETFLERAILVETSDTSDPVATIVTTFPTPVTFDDIITVNGRDGTLESTFNSPVVINNPTAFGSILNYPSLKIVTGEGGNVGLDPKLEFNILGQKTGDIVLHQNEIYAAVYNIHTRGSQDYSIKTSISNVTPNVINVYGSDQTEQINFGGAKPIKSGDIILKGSQTYFSGSLGWIFANDYIQIVTRSGGGFVAQIIGVQGNATGTIVRLNYATGIRNIDLGITSSTQIKISGATGTVSVTNGVWKVYSTTFGANNNFVDFLINVNLPIYTAVPAPNNGFPVDQVSQPNIVIARSQTAFKEIGVLGAESIRTETSVIGDYKLGINTVARSEHSAYSTSFVSNETTPRANLDVVGTTFISGKKILSYATESGLVKTQTNQDNAFMIGGDSATPINTATLRVSTTNTGRVGINATLSQTDRSLTVIGNARITGDFKFESDIDVDGGDITSSNATFGIANQVTLSTLSIGGYATTANLFNSTNGIQTVNIGTGASTSTLNIHNNSTNSTINLANSAFSNRSIINIGGAFNNPSNSLLNVKNAITRLDGDLEVNGGDIASTSSVVNLFTISGFATTINFGTFTTTLNLGGISGTTTIRNPLTVNGTARVNGNIILNGGLDNSSVTVSRGVLGSNASFHSAGSPSNLNVTFLKFIDDIDKFTPITNIVVATSTLVISSGNPFNLNDVVRFNTTSNGLIANQDYYVVGNVNNISFQVSTQPSGLGAITVITGSPAGLEVTLKSHFVDNEGGRPLLGQYNINGVLNNAISATNHAFISDDLVKFSSVTGLVGVNVNTEYYVRDIASDTFKLALTPGGNPINISGTPSGVSIYPILLYVNNKLGIELYDYLLIDNEIVQVQTPPTSTAPYVMKVTRGEYGTTAASHSDQTVFYQLEITPSATYVFPNSIANDTINVVELAEFGGSFNINDYIKIDNEFFRITGINASVPKSLKINSGLVDDNTFTVASTTGNTYIKGTLQVDKSITLSGSGTPNTDLFTITNGAVTPAIKFQVDSATGNTLNDGTLTVNNSITLNGSVTAGLEYFTITNGFTTPVITFRVDSQSGNTDIKGDVAVNVDKFSISAATGDTSVGRYLTVQGLSSANPVSNQNVFSVRNLGVSGVNEFEIKQDGSINSFGIDNYYNRNGGRKWLFISTENNTDSSVSTSDNTILKSNINYFVKPSGSDSVLVLRLPSNPVTGDMIRFVDVGGNLSYNCTLVVRAPVVSGNAVRIQGDTSGTRAGGLGTSYASGELLVNTPNAAFGLIYLGPQDGDGATIGTTQQGWWLMEI